jgi:transposase
MKNEIIALRKEGKSYNQIASLLNCSKGTVSYHCQRLRDNKDIQSRNQWKFDRTILDTIKNDEENTIRSLYLDGFSSREIAECLCLDFYVVSRYIKFNKLRREFQKLMGYDAVKRRYKRIKKLAVIYKGGKCEGCGYSRCLEALDFHHKNPKEKDFNISSYQKKSWNTIKKELDKCICLCSNCHRELHAGVLVL